MKLFVLSGLFVMALFCVAPAAETVQTGIVGSAQVAPETKRVSPAAAPAPQTNQHGFGHTLLLYIPNRIFDVLDIVRLRVRVGPGLALGFRVTKYTDIFLGSYASVYLGLPGPRQFPHVPWLLGTESRSGLAAGLADSTVTSYESNPGYSDTEIGAGAQVVLAGAEVGVDAAEVFDLVLGLFTVDFRGDDL